MLFFLDNLQIYQMSVSLQRVFIVLDLRLTKVGVQRYSFFYAHAFHPLLFLTENRLSFMIFYKFRLNKM